MHLSESAEWAHLNGRILLHAIPLENCRPAGRSTAFNMSQATSQEPILLQLLSTVSHATVLVRLATAPCHAYRLELLAAAIRHRKSKHVLKEGLVLEFQTSEGTELACALLLLW